MRNAQGLTRPYRATNARAVVAQNPCFLPVATSLTDSNIPPPLSNEEQKRRHESVFGLTGPDRKSLAHTWINCFLPNGLAKYALAPLRMASSNIGLS